MGRNTELLKRARKKLNKLKKGEATAAFAGYHWNRDGDKRKGIARDKPKEHMSKKERLRRKWEGRNRYEN